MKKRIIKLWNSIITIALALLFSNCNSELAIEQSSYEPNYKTVSLNETVTFLENQIKTNSTERISNTIPFNLDLKNIQQEPIINSNQLLTIIPATTKYHNIYSRVIVIKVNDTIKAAVINMTKSIDYKQYSGIISITDLYGNFINGFRVENGVLISKFVNYSKTSKKSNTNRSNYNCPDPYYTYSGCYNSLEEITISSSNKINLIYFFIYDSAQLDFSSGGSNSESWEYSNSGGGGDSQYNDPTNYCPNGYDAYGNCVEDDKIYNNLTNPCASNIFSELEYGVGANLTFNQSIILPDYSILQLNFNQIILGLFNNSNNTHYTIRNYEIGDKNAQTVGTIITLDDSYINSATQLSIARTIIHETIHTYLNSVYYSLPDLENKSLYEKMTFFAEDNGYNLNDPYQTNSFHHDFMGQFVNAMAYSLYEWDKNYGSGGNLGWNYYYSMGFGGLFQTDNNGKIISESDTFKKIIQNETDRQNIANIIFNELKANNNAKGEKCN